MMIAKKIPLTICGRLQSWARLKMFSISFVSLCVTFYFIQNHIFILTNVVRGGFTMRRSAQTTASVAWTRVV